MYIKESFVYRLEGREMHCHGGDCGYWRTIDDHSYGGFDKLRMYKVDGEYRCEGCLQEMLTEIKEALE